MALIPGLPDDIVIRRVFALLPRRSRLKSKAVSKKWMKNLHLMVDLPSHMPSLLGFPHALHMMLPEPCSPEHCDVFTCCNAEIITVQCKKGCNVACTIDVATGQRLTVPFVEGLKGCVLFMGSIFMFSAKEIRKYDVATKAWSLITTDGECLQALVCDEKQNTLIGVYIRYTSSRDYEMHLKLYDPKTDTWSEEAFGHDEGELGFGNNPKCVVQPLVTMEGKILMVKWFQDSGNWLYTLNSEGKWDLFQDRIPEGVCEGVRVINSCLHIICKSGIVYKAGSMDWTEMRVKWEKVGGSSLNYTQENSDVLSTGACSVASYLKPNQGRLYKLGNINFVRAVF